ncbi:MAG: MMPL family transporter [Deltaproteobacteria bacterium]|nr:MAG: MMPL family transporter [Deltaproteobacteria bacterium]
MIQQLDAVLGRVLAAWVDGVRARAAAVVVGTLLVTVPLLVYTALGLGINSDNVRLLADDVPSQRALTEFALAFPILNDALIVVVDAPTPERARDAAEALAGRLAEQPDRYRDVYVPGGGHFFERNGLLYWSVDELEDFVDHMSGLQPLIAELERDDSVASLANMVQAGLESGPLEPAGGARWAAILDEVGQATHAAYTRYPVAVAWDELLRTEPPAAGSTRSVILLDPVLEFDSLLAAAPSMRGIREAAQALGYDAASGVQVRITGNPALNYEEMLGLAQDIVVAGVFCFLLVGYVLYRALRSLRLVIAALATLLVGLVWTAAFATAAVGQLNLVSIAFAVLFIGLGVDFAIHLGMHYVALRRDGFDHAAALQDAARHVGSSLVLCAITTAIGFYVFVPTDYRGVAELGLISGTGMVIILAQTLTFFVALISSWLPYVDAPDARESLRFDARWFAAFTGRPRAVRAAALVLGLAAIFTLQWARFDPNVVRMRDPSTESVQAFNDLLAQNDQTSPWFANVVAPDLRTAERLSRRLSNLDVVGRVITLEDFVPEHQELKREILTDLAMILEAPRPTASATGRPSVEERLDALRELRDFLSRSALSRGSSELAASIRSFRDRLDGFLDTVEREGGAEQALANLERSVLAPLSKQLRRLRAALDPEIVELEDLPRDLTTRMVAVDGRARLQVFPRENLNEGQALERFVDAVYGVAPQATGLAVNLVEFGHATVASLKQALVSAVTLIAILLWLLWRRVDRMLLVLAPLLLGAVLTGASMVALGVSFNFTNVIVIPLILGMGVDSGIHMVQRASRAAFDPRLLLGTTTARAVFFSSLTTIVSFGSLALSSHPGMSSLGVMLTVGMLFILLSNLVVLPALLPANRR